MPFRTRTAAGALALSLLASALSIATIADAAGTPADKCEATKLKQTGKLTACVMTSLAKTTQAGEASDITALEACAAKFDAQLTKAETKAEGACPTTGDADALATAVTGFATGLSGDVSGSRFVDNGDGTVRDTDQGVTWQKLTAGTGLPSSVDQMRAAGDILPWLGSLNGDATSEGLGGHSDWGLPTLAQLQSILDCTTLPCTFTDAVLGPEPTPAAGGSTYVLSGETGTLPMSTIPCLKVVRLEDGSVACQDLPSVNGSSRARIMNNAR